MTRYIAVIGAGASGLITAQVLRTNGYQVQVFEKTHRIGGIWAYTDEKESHSSMYKSLRTNLPTGISFIRLFNNFCYYVLAVMQYVQYPFPRDTRSFPTHWEVHKYLESFANFNKIIDLVNFNSTVEDVSPLDANNANTKWNIRYKVSSNGIETYKSQCFDNVVVCSGHFSDPFIPNISGIESFTGSILHSHSYREPIGFENKTVIVVGKGPSGQDISKELLGISKCIYVSHPMKEDSPMKTTIPIQNNEQDHRVDKPPIKCVSKTGDVVFMDDSSVQADIIIFCTGYNYTFPFLQTGILHEPEYALNIDEHGIRKSITENFVAPLYKHIVHVEYPTLAFIGLNSKNVPFMTFELQSKFYSKIVSNEISLPDRTKMMEELQKNVKMMQDCNIPLRKFHYLGERQTEYYRELGLAIGDIIPNSIQEMYEDATILRNSIPFDYRSAEYSFNKEKDTWRRVLLLNGIEYVANSSR